MADIKQVAKQITLWGTVLVGLAACAKPDDEQPPAAAYAKPVLGRDPTQKEAEPQDQLLGYDFHHEADIHGADIHSYYDKNGNLAYVQAGPNTVDGIYKLLTGVSSLGNLATGAGWVMSGIAQLKQAGQQAVPENVITLDNSSQSTATTNAQLTSILKSNPQLSALLNNDPTTLNYLNNNPKTVTNLSNYLNQNQNYSPTNVVKALQMASQNQNNDQQNSAPPPPKQNGWYGSEVLPSDIKDPRVRNSGGRVVGYMVFPERSDRISRAASVLTAKVA